MNKLLVALFVLFLSQVSFALEGGEAEWKLITEEDGVKVFKRDFPGSTFKEFRGEIVIKSSLTSFAALLLDGDNMSSWMHKTKKVETVEQINDRERIAYMLFDFTPMPSRDLVVRNKITQDPTSLAVTYHMEYMPEHSALEDTGSSHMEGITGFVLAEPVGDGNIKITYQAHVEPGSWILNWIPMAGVITNSLLSSTPLYTLLNAKEEIEKDEYQNMTLSFIQEPSKS